ncbi:hypothetical protein VKT23_020589 [Stygiomarasmius scandens]|uniref:Uncharacterized protein n=1 Tax=Marasmiellus scandens TaxID=2682957 RepID=A0ABR1IIS6_9AGAR
MWRCDRVLHQRTIQKIRRSPSRLPYDPTKWEEERRDVVDAAGDEDEEEAEGDDVDQLGSADEDGQQKKASKKRKRESEGGASTKAKGTKGAKAKNDGDAPPKKPRASTSKGKKNRNRKSKEMVESEDNADGIEDGPSKKASLPPSTKAKKDNKDDVDEAEKMAEDPEAVIVRDWRHRLQKTFLSNKAVPKEKDMPAMDQLFTAIESYDKMKIEYLQFS